MKITDQQLARFSDMVKNFATRHGHGFEIETNSLSMERTHVRFTGKSRRKDYAVHWCNAVSLTDAGTAIFSDALVFFGISSTYSNAPCAGSFEIKNVIFNAPATIVLWADGTKTVVKCQEGDEYSKDIGLAMCFAKKALGNSGNYNNVFKKWIPEEKEPVYAKLPDMPARDVASKFVNTLRDILTLGLT